MIIYATFDPIKIVIFAKNYFIYRFVEKKLYTRVTIIVYT